MYQKFYGPFLPVAHGPRLAELPLAAQAAIYNSWLPEPEPKPELPEFHFSPRVSHASDLLSWDPRFHFERGAPAPIHIIDASPKRCVFPRPHRAEGKKRDLPLVEENWLNLIPYFKHPVTQHTLPTKGTMKPQGLDRFLARVAEIRAIEQTSCCEYHRKGGEEVEHSSPDPLELETIQQEMARNGIASISLQSSSDDDDDTPAFDVAASTLTEYIAPDPALVRRIEWERYVKGCGLSQRVYLSVRDGKAGIDTDSVRLDKDTLRAYAPKFKEMLAGRTLRDLLNDRARVAHYGVIGSVLYDYKRSDIEASINVDDIGLGIGDELCSIEEPHGTCTREACKCKRCHLQHEIGRPMELAFHVPTMPFEPSEWELWGDEDATTAANEAAMFAYMKALW